MNKQEIFKIFGENLQRKREGRNISLQELSNKTKINIRYLKRIENGTAVGLLVSHVFILSQALNIDACELCQNI